jgi:hypothetical protein
LEGLADCFFVDQSIRDVLMKDARDQRLVWKTFLLGSSFQFFKNALSNLYLDRSVLPHRVDYRLYLPPPLLESGRYELAAFSICRSKESSLVFIASSLHTAHETFDSGIQS